MFRFMLQIILIRLQRLLFYKKPLLPILPFRLSQEIVAIAAPPKHLSAKNSN